MNPKATLYYAHDPMCSWCWGFRKTWLELQQLLANELDIAYLLGGLAADSNQAMPEGLQVEITNTWHKIEQAIPGTKFNFDFWQQCQPRRSTYPACRAVIAASRQRNEAAMEMILAIQQAYYLHAQNTSDHDTLIGLADQLKLNVKQFSTDLESAATQHQLMEEIHLCRDLGIYSFPRLALTQEQGNGQIISDIHIDYNKPGPMLDQIHQALLNTR